MMYIKILGPGCANCKRLEAVTRSAAATLDWPTQVEKVEDLMTILEYGVMRTPALVVNEKVVLSGRVPNVSEVASLLREVSEEQ